jgi:hypothetical protein
VPVPFKVKGQFETVGVLTMPVAVTATLPVLSITPETLPVRVSPPPQVALKVPVMLVAVWVAIVNWKLVHDVGLGTVDVGDVQLPTSDDVAAELVPLVPGLAGVGVLLTGVGASTLVVDLLALQPIVITDAASRVAARDRDIFILHTCNGTYGSVSP